jgi:hypothetical protein
MSLRNLLFCDGLVVVLRLVDLNVSIAAMHRGTPISRCAPAFLAYQMA